MDGCTIRLANTDDLNIIHGWLKREHDDGNGSFLSNYNLLEEGCQHGLLSVLIRDPDEGPVAFALGDRVDDLGILAVKPDCRKKGLGRRLAQHFIDSARKRDVIGLFGECSPPTSLGFWKKMGYISVPNPYCPDNKCWAACPLPHDNDLPEATRIMVAIGIGEYNQIKYSFQSEAAIADDGYILAQDFVEFVGPSPNKYLEIRVNGDVIVRHDVRYVDEIGGEYYSPWLRVRRLLVNHI